MSNRTRAVTGLLVLVGLAGAGPAMSAESFDNCTGYITSLPATLTRSGTWCLRQDLSTSISSGAAIEVATNNVTINCNDFKLGGLMAGTSTDTVGIYSADRLNTTVRQCNIRGFLRGISLDGGGQVVEANALDGNTEVGIYTYGDGAVVRNNIVRDTGGRPASAGSVGISMTGQGTTAEDNKVNAVFATGSANGWDTDVTIGIAASGDVRNNTVTGIIPPGTTGNAVGIQLGARVSVAMGNRIQQNFATRGSGIVGMGDTQSICKDNVVQHYDVDITNCQLDGNVTQPAIH